MFSRKEKVGGERVPPGERKNGRRKRRWIGEKCEQIYEELIMKKIICVKGKEKRDSRNRSNKREHQEEMVKGHYQEEKKTEVEKKTSKK